MQLLTQSRSELMGLQCHINFNDLDLVLRNCLEVGWRVLFQTMLFFCLSPWYFRVMAFLKCPFSQLETSVEKVGNPVYLTSVTSGFNIKTSVKLWTMVIVCLKQQVILVFSSFKFSLWGSTVTSGGDQGCFFVIYVIAWFYLLTKQQPFHFLLSSSCVNKLLKIPVRTKPLKKEFQLP